MARIASDATLANCYRLVRPVRVGAAGEVWVARDERFVDRVVDVQILTKAAKDDPAAEERRRQGIESVLRQEFIHPNAPRTYEYGESESTRFVVLEHVEGETLAERLVHKGPPKPADAARIAMEIAEVIQKAHDAGFVHGDLRAETVLVTATGSVKVLDLGLTPAAWEAWRQTAPSEGGAAQYRTPGPRVAPVERARQADLSALGTLLYQMLAGRPLVRHSEEAGLDAGLVARDLRAVQVPEGLAILCERTLSADRRNRPQSAESFASALRSMAASPSPIKQEASADLLDDRHEAGFVSRREAWKAARRQAREARSAARAAGSPDNAERAAQEEAAKAERATVMAEKAKEKEAREQRVAAERARAKTELAARKEAAKAEKAKETEARTQRAAEEERARVEAARRAEEQERAKTELAAQKEAVRAERAMEQEARAQRAAEEQQRADAERASQKERTKAELAVQEETVRAERAVRKERAEAEKAREREARQQQVAEEQQRAKAERAALMEAVRAEKAKEREARAQREAEEERARVEAARAAEEQERAKADLVAQKEAVRAEKAKERLARAQRAAEEQQRADADRAAQKEAAKAKRAALMEAAKAKKAKEREGRAQRAAEEERGRVEAARAAEQKQITEQEAGVGGAQPKTVHWAEHLFGHKIKAVQTDRGALESPRRETKGEMASPRGMEKRGLTKSKLHTSGAHKETRPIEKAARGAPERAAAPEPKEKAARGQWRSRVPVGIAAIVVALTIGVGAVLLTNRGTPSPSRPLGRPPTPSLSASASASPASVEVPQVAGGSVSQARTQLLEVGLQFVRAVPTTGPPGVVVASDPSIGTRVAPGSEVTLFVGAPPDRAGGRN